MLNEQTFDKLYGMKLLGMAEAFKEQSQQPSFQDLSFDAPLWYPRGSSMDLEGKHSPQTTPQGGQA